MCIETCQNKSTYGFEFKKPLRCKEHKDINMWHSSYKRCIEKDCPKSAQGKTKFSHKRRVIPVQFFKSKTFYFDKKF